MQCPLTLKKRTFKHENREKFTPNLLLRQQKLTGTTTEQNVTKVSALRTFSNYLPQLKISEDAFPSVTRKNISSMQR